MKLYTEKELDDYAVEYKYYYKPDLPKGIELPAEEVLIDTALDSWNDEELDFKDTCEFDDYRVGYIRGIKFVLKKIKEQL